MERKFLTKKEQVKRSGVSLITKDIFACEKTMFNVIKEI